MAELKTRPTGASVETFLSRIKDPPRQTDCRSLVDLLRGVTKDQPRMWGESIVGFGDVHCVYASGRELDWFSLGFSPRQRDLTLYVLSGFDGQDDLLEKLGKYRTGKCCLYVKSLSDLHLPTLKKLLRRSLAETRRVTRQPVRPRSN